MRELMRLMKMTQRICWCGRVKFEVHTPLTHAPSGCAPVNRQIQCRTDKYLVYYIQLKGYFLLELDPTLIETCPAAVATCFAPETFKQRSMKYFT